MLSTQLAPSAAASATASGSQTSSQTVSASAPLGRLDVQRAAPGRERALLVEDAVVGQLALVVAREDRAVRRARARRCARGRRRATGSRRRAAPRPRPASTLGLGLAGAQERGPQQQILGRIARDRELRREHELGTRARGIGTGVGDALPVLGKRSDREVELGQREAEHRFHRSSGLRGGASAAQSDSRCPRAPCTARRRASAASRTWPGPSASSSWATRRARGTRRAASRTGSACARA